MLSRIVRPADVDVLEKERRASTRTDFRSFFHRLVHQPLHHRVREKSPGRFRDRDDAQHGPMALNPLHTDGNRLRDIFHDAASIARNGLPESLLPPDFPRQVYLTFDVDGLDPSIMPATGTPVPGGLGWYQSLDIAERTLSGRDVLGFDVVELAPVPGMHASDFAAARLVYALMGITARGRG